MKIDKQRLMERIVSQLERELATLEAAARAAHEAATHEESKAEDQHDTRGLEASYLAGAQAARIAELKAQVSALRQLKARPFGPDEAIAPGALVELEHQGRRTLHLLVAQGGGITVPWEGTSVQLLTPRAPLGEALLGRQAGDVAEVEAQGATREYEILGVS